MNRMYVSHALPMGLLVALAFILHAGAAAPRLTVDEPNYNFGEQHNSQTIEHTFVVRNEGEATLEITDIRSSCGCTVGNVSSRSVPPGGTSEITGRFNLRGRQGTQRSLLTVESNDPAQPRTQLTMSGVAVQEMTIRPNQVFFGQIFGGERSMRQIDVVGRPESPFEIVKIETGSDHFTAKAVATDVPHHYKVDIEARAPQQAGVINDIVRIHTTHPQYAVLQVPVNAQVSGALTYAPNNISLLAGNTTPVTRYIVVRPGAVQDFEITDIVSPLEDIRVQVLNMPNQGYRIQLSNITPSPELVGRSLLIHTNVESMPLIDIPFTIVESSH